MKKDPVDDDQVPADAPAVIAENESKPEFVKLYIKSSSESTVADGGIRPQFNPETLTPTELMKGKNTDIITTLLPHEINPEDFSDVGDRGRLSGGAFLEDFGHFPFVAREVHERSEDR